ncbi:MAG TPA: sigma-54 dependent transcriptional regulator [Anaerovoracaceae bacterium]|nr:sigma-54 dependent transcriptional regulator [Anaerovoracaceae bacterium]
MKNKQAYKIIIVDDEIEYQNITSLILENEGYKTETFSNGVDALDYMENNNVDLVITDLKMPKISGLELIKEIKMKNNDTDVLVVTAFGSIESAVEAMKVGAAEYFIKSDEPADLLIKINRLAKLKRLERKSNILLKKQNSPDFFLNTKSKSYQDIITMCNKTANSGINILLLGESGVGKEVIANYIHKISNRCNEPFVPVNCQVFPEGIIESELFGHEKGSFTGAIDSRLGKFEEANYGTLFLDEICDLPMSTQGKLLRSLETKKISKVGGNKSIDLDVRFISATNKSPFIEIENKKFREDLLYRINTLTITIPPLRKRKEDLPGLIAYFINKIETDQKKKIVKVDDSVMDYLLKYDYPGNIRELKNIIERLVALSDDGIITNNELFLQKSSNCLESIFDPEKELRDARADFEKAFIIASMEKCDNKVSECAKKLGITPRQLRNKLEQYSISKSN